MTRRRGQGRVAFLAKADKFRELLEAGHAQRAIYDEHETELGISYSQFNRYVARYLTEQGKNDGHQKGKAGGEQKTAESGTANKTGLHNPKPKATGAFEHSADSDKRKTEWV